MVVMVMGLSPWFPCVLCGTFPGALPLFSPLCSLGPMVVGVLLLLRLSPLLFFLQRTLEVLPAFLAPHLEQTLGQSEPNWTKTLIDNSLIQRHGVIGI
jgi:hypothetical protein